jgi:hypothetical protein
MTVKKSKLRRKSIELNIKEKENMNRKKISSLIMTVLVSASVLAGCSTNKLSNTNTNSASSSNSSNSASEASKVVPSFIVTSDMITYDKEDYYTDWKAESPNYIELSGSGASLKSGTGAEIKGSKITITAAGVYAFSGKLDNGQIIVDVQDKGTVKLVLNGAEINSSDSSPIYVKNSSKTIISLQEGTQNLIKDGEKYVLEDTANNEPNAAIFSKGDLIINGTGSLTVYGNYNNGIQSKDDLKITAGNINIYAKDDGLLGKDLLLVKEGNIKIEAGGDGLKSTNDTEEGKGFIGLQGGTFEIKSGADGIQAGTSMLITGGKYTIVTGGGSAGAPVKVKEEGPGRPMGGPGQGANTNTTNTTTTTAGNTQSFKAIKAASDISISGGTFTIDSADDSIHSNNTINIAGGEFSLTAGDDGIHADASIIVKDGKINIAKSYEGIESALITIDGGETNIIASDDGLNVGGGADGSSVNGRTEQNSFSSSGDRKLTINGGYIVVNSEGDSLDSNGSMYMNGGTVVVSGPTANNNGALDYDGEFVVKGGFLIAAGSSGMAQAPSDSSTQYSLAMSFSSTQEAGKFIALKDSSGKTITAFAPKKQYQTVVITSPELKKDGEYTIYSGGSSTGTSVNGLYKDGEYVDGTKVVSFKAATITTWLNESGVTTAKSGGPGGQKGFGGKGNKGSRMAPGDQAPPQAPQAPQ